MESDTEGSEKNSQSEPVDQHEQHEKTSQSSSHSNHSADNSNLLIKSPSGKKEENNPNKELDVKENSLP